MKRIVLFIGACFGLFFFWMIQTNAGSITITPGDGVSVVAQKLSDAGVVRTPVVFKISYALLGGDSIIYPGDVVVGSSCGIRCIVREVVQTDHQSIRVTILEGHDLRDVARIMQDKKIGNVSELYARVGEPAKYTSREDLSSTFSFLKDVPDRVSYEGYLFPDTYEVRAGITTDEFIAMLLKNFDRRVTPELRNLAKKQGRTLHEVVTLASILEKEVRSREDRELVADLLLRRLKIGMGLQVDASVNYVTARENLFTTAQDRATDSPWNTYKYRGLPPGPISNPSLDAIEASLNPKPNEYLFYLTGSDGRTHFGRTLEEHVANKRYLK